MGPSSYMRSVVDRNVVIRRIPTTTTTTTTITTTTPWLYSPCRTLTISILCGAFLYIKIAFQYLGSGRDLPQYQYEPRRLHSVSKI